mgnify:CR=1 FL=1
MARKAEERKGTKLETVIHGYFQIPCKLDELNLTFSSERDSVLKCLNHT